MGLLDVRGVTKRFGGLTAVRDVSLTVQDGDIVGLIGPNGAGKTTLFNLISGVYKPDTGRVLFRDHDITRLPLKQVESTPGTGSFRATATASSSTMISRPGIRQ